MSTFLKFTSIGVFLLPFSLLLFYLAYNVYDLPLYQVYIFIYFLFIYISYALNSKFTFKKKSSKEDLFKYYIIYILGLLFGLAFLYVFEYYFDFSKFTLILLNLGPRVLFTYTLSKLLIFKN